MMGYSTSHPLHTPESPQILADDRERDAGVIAALQRLDGVVVTVQRLALGDYQANDTLIVERKTLADFAASIADGRLFTQARRLAAAPRHSLFILEGTAADLAACAMRREAMQGALISLSLIFGIPVLRSISADETARLIVYAIRQLRATAHGATQRHGYRPKGTRKRQLYMLQGLPGIGPARAERLLDTFGTVQAICNANPDQLAEVPGIGRRTAEAMERIIRETREAYFDGNQDPGL
jgi:ERCC4-type nuclease